MSPILGAVAVAAALVLGVAAAPAATVDLPARITLDGVGGVRPGLTEQEVEARWGIRLRLEDAFGPECQPALVRAGGLDGYAVFIRGRFAALFLRRGAVTGKGVRIGSTLAQVRRAYPRGLTSRPNKYTPGARDLFVRRTGRPHWQLRIDVSPRGRVTQIAFGDDAVRLVEGCA